MKRLRLVGERKKVGHVRWVYDRGLRVALITSTKCLLRILILASLFVDTSHVMS